MIPEFIKRFDNRKVELEDKYRAKRPDGYEEIVSDVIKLLTNDDDCRESPDPERITKIDHGEYQGTLVFVIGGTGYQPYHYWYVKVGYGSCSGCDSFEAIRGWSDEPIESKELAGYMGLALDVVQGLRSMQSEE